ncbi:hypothetical protein HNE05_16350 [Aquipseudomonas campi]|uniref:Uncharacterized protein n=1 Tax=Aquipseudomonas campi TaxID=2731681 RepID=A0A6M8F7X5_9GAMM|nr:hypothetical protein [Pseudomonas campi]QKE64854.1 hypothetical protein HNE05_16350 [Pseudomonas campi]
MTWRVLLAGSLQILLVSAAAILLFVYLHETAVSMAVARGRTLRGGVSWGITVQLALYVFAFLTLLQNAAALRWPARRMSLAVLAWLVFAVLFTLLGNPFGSWAHPYRWALLMFCSAAGCALSLVGQGLWQLVQQRRLPVQARV